MKSSTRRPYRMEKRAEQAAETKERILQATLALFSEKLLADITLGDIADRAGVSVQTVIRKFGSRDKVIEALAGWIETYGATNRPLTGGHARLVACLVEEYERVGPTVLSALSQERDVPLLRPLLQRGREMHQQWISEAFSDGLVTLPPSVRKRAMSGLIVALDVYAWKLLRIDNGFTETQTAQSMELLVKGLLEGATP